MKKNLFILTKYLSRLSSLKYKKTEIIFECFGWTLVCISVQYLFDLYILLYFPVLIANHISKTFLQLDLTGYFSKNKGSAFFLSFFVVN